MATPAGLNPGDQFRFLFLTSGTQAATSTDLSDYNTFVNSQASGVTYQGSVVSWKVVRSTATVNARDNVGGFGTIVPVYLTNGTILAGDLTTSSSNKGLWSGEFFTAPTGREKVGRADARERLCTDGEKRTETECHIGPHAPPTDKRPCLLLVGWQGGNFPA